MCEQVYAIIKRDIYPFVSLERLTTNCLDEELKAEESYFCFQHVVTHELNLNRRVINIFHIPANYTFSRNMIGGG